MAYGEAKVIGFFDQSNNLVCSNPFGYQPWRDKKTFEVSKTTFPSAGN